MRTRKIAIVSLFLAWFTTPIMAPPISSENGIPAACPPLPKRKTNPKTSVARTPEQIEAEKLVSQAQGLLGTLSRENVMKAISLLAQAINADRDNAKAYAALALAHANSTRYGDVPRQIAGQKTWENLTKALSLDPDLIEALRLFADRSVFYWWDYKCAEKTYKQALALEPQNARTHFAYAQLLGMMGNFELAFKHIDQAVASPDAAARNYVVRNSGRMRFMAHQYDWVLNHYEKVLASSPGNPAIPHFYRGLAYAQKGQFQEALAEHKLSAPSSKGDAGGVAALARAYAQAGEVATAKEILKELLEREARGEHVVEYQIAAIYEALDDAGETFRWLNKAVDDGDGVLGWLGWLKHDPRWDRLRSDARFKELLKRVKLSK